MGEPALQLLPAEEAAGEAAARQATRLIVIEGGKGAATAAAEDAAVTGAAGAGEGVLAAAGRTVLTGIGAIGVFFLVLLWPSSTASDDTLPPRDKPVPPPAPQPQPAPKQAPDIAQKCPLEKTCPPHAWVLTKPGKTFQEATDDLQRQIDTLKKSPSRADEMRGKQFEKDALRLNNQKRPIESAGAEYTCSRCGAVQEVDAKFQDGQIAETKSARLKTVKGKGPQARRLVDLQTSLNCDTGTDFKPLAKLDNGTPDADAVADKYRERGFEIERLNTVTGG